MCQLCTLMGYKPETVHGGGSGMETVQPKSLLEKLEERLAFHLAQIHNLERMIKLMRENPQVLEFDQIYAEYLKVNQEFGR